MICHQAKKSGLIKTSVVLVFLFSSLTLPAACTSTDIEDLNGEEALLRNDDSSSGTTKVTKNADTLAINPSGSSISSAKKQFPIPEAATWYGVQNFMTTYRPAWIEFQPLVDEYRLYFKTLVQSPETERQEAEISLRLRMEENLTRAHWAFMRGIQELMEYMNKDSNALLARDREANFVARMKTLAFMSRELSTLTRNTQHVDFCRKVYIAMSERYFGRVLEDVMSSTSASD